MTEGLDLTSLSRAAQKPGDGPERYQRDTTDEQVRDLRDAFTESDLPYKVDLIDCVNTSPNFENIIEARSISITAKAVEASS